MGGIGNRAAEEDWCWGLNRGLAAMLGRVPHSFGKKKDHTALARREGELHGFGAPFAMQLRKKESKMYQQCRALS